MNAAMLWIALMLGQVEAPRAEPGAGVAPLVSEGAEPTLTWEKIPGGTPPPVEPGSAPATPAVEPIVEAVPAAPEPPPIRWERADDRWPRPSRPIRWRVDPFLEFGTLTVTDPGYRALDDNRHLRQLAFGVRFDRRIGAGPLRLGGGLHYAWATAFGGAYGGAFASDLGMHGVIASARAAVALVEGIDVVGALEAGPAFARVYLDSDVRGSTSRRVLGSFAIKAGLALYLPRQWLRRRGAARITGGLNLMMGYGLHTALRLAPVPDVADDAIATSGVSLGDVRMRGYVWSLGVFVRFM